MAHGATEWVLQKRLTTAWLSRDTLVLNDEPLFLAAWEVMASYRINDARRHWSEPSIDFLLLDRTGRLVVLELKREVRTPREAWSVLCQVTHRAHILASGYEQERLVSAYVDCHSGTDGRQVLTRPVRHLVEAHAHAFGQGPLGELPGLPVRRLVMAKSFARSFPQILASFNNDTPQQVATRLDRYRPRGEIKRYLELSLEPTLVDTAPVRAITTDGAAWPGCR